MNERDELKPCPFCGGEPGMVQQTKINWAVMCHVCGAEGGWSNPSDAIALWNRRPTPPQAVPALTDEQIAAQDARYAIDGAIAYGRMGTNQPPAGHWLTEYWAIGQQLAKLGETSIWDNQTPVDKTVKFARYDAMEAAGRQASEEMRRLERYLEETSAPQPSPEPKEPR